MLGREGGNYDATSGSLAFQDLQKAHTETIIPVSDADMDSRHAFKTMDDIISHRNRQDIVPLTLEESNQTLQGLQRAEDESATRRAFRLVKESEDVARKSQTFWKGLQRLK
jgi:predicted amidophosphoribosyltransferase